MEFLAQYNDGFAGGMGGMGGGFNMVYLVITGVAMLLSRWAGSNLQKKFQKFSQLPIEMTGAQVAQQMLDDAGIHDVEIISTPGQLTDHYNPVKKTVNLSEVVCHQRNVAAAAVAAHEVGHAVQHATAYPALKMRSTLVPIVNLSSKYMNWILMIGLMLAAGGNTTLLLVGIVLFAATTLFSLITLPVEFDASKRAMVWIDQRNIMSAEYEGAAKSALKAAATTYVVAAVASLGQLLYFVYRYMIARR